jgi:hypothetical protein
LKQERQFVLTQEKSQLRKKKLVAAVDDFDEEVVKNLFTVSMLHSKRPILKSPLRVVCGNTGFQGGRTSSRKLAFNCRLCGGVS